MKDLLGHTVLGPEEERAGPEESGLELRDQREGPGRAQTADYTELIIMAEQVIPSSARLPAHMCICGQLFLYGSQCSVIEVHTISASCFELGVSLTRSLPVDQYRMCIDIFLGNQMKMSFE